MANLDVNSAVTAIDQTIAELRNIQSEITNVLQAVYDVTSLDDQLTGSGGDAIRAFFLESHVPFLVNFFDFLG